MITEKIVLNERGAALDAYILKTSKEMPNMTKRPAILVIPGGGYKVVSDREGEPVAMPFIAQGYNAFVLTYSVGKGNATFPKPLEEAELALELIRKNAEKWNIIPDKIAAIGFSAGGHLAAALSTMGRVRPNALILGYPCILAWDSPVLAEPIISLDDKVTKDTPPTFIVSSASDKLVPIENSLRFADALNKAGVSFEMHIFAKGYHGFSIANEAVFADKNALEENAHTAEWVPMCITWLKKNLNF